MPLVMIEYPRLSKSDNTVMTGIDQHGSQAGPPRGQSDATPAAVTGGIDGNISWRI